jgi:hypothetical protein
MKYGLNLTYSNTIFNEVAANDGSINNSVPITITLAGDTYSASTVADYVSCGKLVVTNKPAGLTAVATLSTATVLSVTLTGNATNHNNSNDVANMTFTFQNGAFTGGAAATVVNFAKNDLSVNFDNPVLTYSGATFNESVTNNGAIDNTTPITITLTGDTYSAGIDFIAENKITVANLPTGLTAVATRTSATVLSVTLTGTAASHANANDVTNLTFTFQNTSFTGNNAAIVTNNTKNNLTVNFNDPGPVAALASKIITIPNMDLQSETEFEVSIYTSQLFATDNVTSYQFNLTWGSPIIQYASYISAGTLSSGSTPVVSAGSGSLTVNLTSGSNIVGTGVLLKLRFTILGDDKTHFTLSDFKYNTTSVATIKGVYKIYIEQLKAYGVKKRD